MKGSIARREFLLRSALGTAGTVLSTTGLPDHLQSLGGRGKTVPAGLAAGDVNKQPRLDFQIILVKTPWEAEAIVQRIKAGEPFAKLAAEKGRLGPISLSTLGPETRNALKGIGPSGVTSFFESPSGYMILKVLAEAQETEPKGMGTVSTPSQPGTEKAHYTTDVSGSYEAVYLFRRGEKPPNYAQDLEAISETRRKALLSGIEDFEAALKELETQSLPDKAYLQLRAHEALGQLWSYQGNMEQALEHFRAEQQIAAGQGLKEVDFETEEKLGIAEMRRGENDNCRDMHNPKSCIFPLCSEAQHHKKSGSENAIQHFLKYLSRDPDDIEVRWLLNLTYMTLGMHPRGVPRKYLIPPGSFASEEDIGQFVDVAPSLGLDVFNMAGGVIVDDFDNDGFLDVVISSYDSSAPLRYFHNNGDGTFSDRSAQAGLSRQLGGLNIIQTDYNNDGWLDIYVMRGGWEEPIRHSLLRNNGDGTFTDVSEDAGLASPARSQTAVWADFDNDGYLDLFRGNEFSPSQLFHNNGDGTFTDISHSAGVDRTACSKGVAAGDYDNDGYPDIYVSNFAGENFLYHNNRDGTFTDMARPLRVQNPIHSFPTWFFDYNNDGWLDLFVSTFVPSLAQVMRSYLGLPTQVETPKLYRNTGRGTFQDVTEEVGLDRVLMTMGANFGDVDNDGFLDLYLGTGGPSYAALLPNVLFRNHGGKHFVDITTSSGTGSLPKGHGIAFADINNDGHQEIFAELGGASPGDKYFSALFRNPGRHGNNWMAIKLVGVKSNRAAFGARIKLTIKAEDGRPRYIHRHVTSGGSFGASPLRQHIGIGKALRVETLEVWWPTSRTRQIFHNLTPNQFIEITEFQKSPRKLDHRTFKI